MFNLLKKYKYQLLLLLIVSFIGLVNYRLGTYLTGWDNLQTELSPALGVKRAFLAVWQEYQSFGLVGGMAHASDLLRAIVVLLMSYVLPQSLVRYVFHVGMWLIGGLGAYKLLKNFPGALFYMLNFATIQLFFLPFEPFSIFFASLPWLIWAFIRPKISIPVLIAINILATPSFYVQTLFVVYMLILGIISAWRLATSFKKSCIPTFLSLSIIVLINLFWILPQGYFLMNGGSKTVANSKINQLATEDVYYQNKARGDVVSFATFKGFYTDLEGKNGSQIFQEWNKYNNTPEVLLVEFSIFAIILLGLTRKHEYRVPFFGIWALSAFALLSNTPGIENIHELIRHNGLMAQIFRAPFTKFAVPLALASSFFFVQGVTRIEELLGGIRARVKQGVAGSMLALIAIISFPVFTGHLFSNLVRTKIPQPYFQTMDYFSSISKEQRIALLPQDSFWGWYNYSWGYSGSGFLWYGIEQPIVSPTFDVWSNKSESYLWEMKAALASQQAPQVHNVLKKYNIQYLIVDDSLLPVSSHQSGFSASRIKDLLAKDETIKLEKKFGTISIYHVTSSAPFVTQVTALPSVGPMVDKTDVDSAYATFGDYQSGTNYYFPFLNLPTEWHVEENSNTFSVKTRVPINMSDYSLKSTIQSLPTSLAASVQGDMLSITVNKTLVEHLDVASATPTQCDKLTICLAYTLPNLSQENGYLVKVKNENTAGQRFFFYVQNNTTGEGVIEDRLRADTAYYMVPPASHFGRGYTIGFQNDSYVGTLSENSLIDLEVYEMPYAELKSLYFEKLTTPGVNPRGYQSTVIYNQAFDPGWKAYSNGKELTNHVIINNWANGWTIPQADEGANRNITFFFLPQILEFIGLAVVSVIGLIAGVHFIIKRL